MCPQLDYKRSDTDGYQHREGVPKKVAPWIASLKAKGMECILFQDGVPAHKSRIGRDYLTV